MVFPQDFVEYEFKSKFVGSINKTVMWLCICVCVCVFYYEVLFIFSALDPCVSALYILGE